MNENKVISYILRLEKLIKKKNYIGYDPYDIKGTKFFLWALSIPRKPFLSNIFRKVILGPTIYFELFFPTLLRKVFLIKPKLNAKGLSLIAKGYFNLFRLTQDAHWLKQGESCLESLNQIRSSGFENPCWGYPFNWDSGVIVPAFTPTAVVTSAAFDAYWEAWMLTRKHEYLEVCSGICDFYCNDLNQSEGPDDTICFSYTPIDRFQVHNINLMVAYCLVRTGQALNKSELLDLGKRAADFTIREQNEDGSIYYWSKEQNDQDPNRIDHYHSGFEIRALWGIWQNTNQKRYLNAFEGYYSFYREKLFYRKDNIIIPMTELSGVYPVNIHACAESILLSASLAKTNLNAAEDLKSVLPWVLQKMLMKSGWFRYLIRKIGPFEVRSNIVYMRWGQAWMFLALTQALLVFNSRMNSDD